MELTREEELTIFRKINGNNRLALNPHTNLMVENTTRAGYFNQGVSRAKLKQYVMDNNCDFDFWKKL